MIKIICFIFGVFVINTTLLAQKTSEEVSDLLDTKSYVGLRVDYMSNIILSDSVKQKFLIALSGNLTPRLQKRIFATIIDRQKDDFLKRAKRECGKDSACIEQTYQQIITAFTDGENLYYATQHVSGELILAAGSWNIKEAIPILENALGNNRYNQRNVLMALAKLGNDSIEQVLMEKYTLSYVLANSQYDTVNDNNILYNLSVKTWSTQEGMQTAMYLKSQKMLLNILDLIYIRGISGWCLGVDCFDHPYVAFFVNEYCNYNYFREFTNFETIKKECVDYQSLIWKYDKKQDKNAEKELEVLLSTEYRTKLRNQIREWIIENVNF